MSGRKTDVIVRFFRFIDTDTTSGCWLWGGSLTNGYGKLAHNGRSVSAHRMAYIIFAGPIPTGLVIDHKCRVRACVNPLHLYLGTAADNSRDKVRSGRQSRVFTDEEYLHILSLRDQLSSRKVAEMFQVTPSGIRNIWKRLSVNDTLK